jgi:hypothetical protein
VLSSEETEVGPELVAGAAKTSSGVQGLGVQEPAPLTGTLVNRVTKLNGTAVPDELFIF